jgi:hypothetical protein
MPKTRRYGCLNAGAPELFFYAMSARQGWPLEYAYSFGRGESRVNTGGDDSRSWDDLSGEETVRVQLDPRTQCCLTHRSACIIICLGSSPTGTMSGAS